MLNKKLLILCLSVALLPINSYAADSLSDDIDSLKEKYKRPDAIAYPADNPYSDAKYALGKQLFFDTRLSGSGVTSCATCHNPSFDWGDGMGKAIGFDHKQLGRKTPTLLNLAGDKLFFWDGRAKSLEQQALGPISAPGEMNMPLEAMIKQLDVPQYKSHFEASFPNEKDPVTKENVAKAIATFERKIVSGTAPFDQWLDGDEEAISESAKRGFVTFNKKANCAACHSGWSFSDSSFHDIGLNDDDIGRAKIVPLATMQHAFKTVGLRNIDRRYPYMHNGSLKTLEAVVDHYNGAFTKRKSLDGFMVPLNLSETEKSDLVAFLHTLTSVDTPVTLPSLPR